MGSRAEAPGDSQPLARANLESDATSGASAGPKRSRPTSTAFRRSPTRQLPHLGYLQLLYRRGFATVATPVVAPTLTALTHHAHAPTTPTTTQAATSDRHPQSEGSRPGTGMQGYLSQATKNYRSPGASKKLRRQRRYAQARPPAGPTSAHRRSTRSARSNPRSSWSFFSCDGVEGGGSITGFGI